MCFKDWHEINLDVFNLVYFFSMSQVLLEEELCLVNDFQNLMFYFIAARHRVNE